jgi:hypothetical protein
LGNVGGIIYKGVESDEHTVGTIVHGKRIAIGHFAIAITNIDSRGYSSRMITENNMVIAKDANARGIYKVVAILPGNGCHGAG